MEGLGWAGVVRGIVAPELRLGGVFRKASQAKESIDHGEEGHTAESGIHGQQTEERGMETASQARLRSLGPSSQARSLLSVS